jgi:hypothetical protein
MVAGAVISWSFELPICWLCRSARLTKTETFMFYRKPISIYNFSYML